MIESDQKWPWYVVYSKPLQELRAETSLIHQGFLVYLPKICESKRVRGRWIRQVHPMFPRYLFVQPAHVEQSIAPLKSTYGVSQLVCLGSKIVTCPNTLIDTIRAAEAQLNGEGATAFAHVGEMIEIVEGPFRGLVSRVVAANEDRVTILLEVLGTLQSLEFSVALCRKA